MLRKNQFAVYEEPEVVEPIYSPTYDELQQALSNSFAHIELLAAQNNTLTANVLSLDAGIKKLQTEFAKLNEKFKKEQERLQIEKKHTVEAYHADITKDEEIASLKEDIDNLTLAHDEEVEALIKDHDVKIASLKHQVKKSRAETKEMFRKLRNDGYESGKVEVFAKGEPPLKKEAPFEFKWEEGGDVIQPRRPIFHDSRAPFFFSKPKDLTPVLEDKYESDFESEHEVSPRSGQIP